MNRSLEGSQKLLELFRASGEVAVTPELLEKARRYAQLSRSRNTLVAYARGFRRFHAWCEERGVSSLPASPETVALFMTFRVEEGAALSTLDQELAAIGTAHRLAGCRSPREEPVVRDVRRGIRRDKGAAQTRKAPLLAADLQRVLYRLPDTLQGARDRALLLLGFAAALRRSELVALEVRDVVFAEKGLKVNVRRSKTDPDGLGQVIGIPKAKRKASCPVHAVGEWLSRAEIESGPIFREVDRHGRVGESALTGGSVARIVKRAAASAGMSPERFSGHSLRAGLATSAAQAGKAERKIMDQTRHKSVAMVRRYIRDGELFRDNAADGLLEE